MRASRPRSPWGFNPPKWLFWLLGALVLAGAVFAAWTALHGAAALHDHPAQPRVGAHWHFENTDITESSGLAASRKQPGVFWTINDSGNDPVLYAFDLQGRDLGSWRVTGTRNRDWEALTLSDCEPEVVGGLADRRDAGDCLYIADTGDNDEKYDSVTIYRIPELSVVTGDGRTAAAATPLTFAYEDGPHDVEALFKDAQGRLNMVTKGRSNGVALYQLPADVWSRRNRVATRIATFAIDPETKYERKVTGASLSPDDKSLALRTYDELYVFNWSEEPLGKVPIQPLRVCDLAGFAEEQGEAIVWTGMPARFVLTSEEDGMISLVDC